MHGLNAEYNTKCDKVNRNIKRDIPGIGLDTKYATTSINPPPMKNSVVLHSLFAPIPCPNDEIKGTVRKKADWMELVAQWRSYVYVA